MNRVMVHGSVRNLVRADSIAAAASPSLRLPQPQCREHHIRLARPIHSQPVDERRGLLEAGVGRDVGEHRHFRGIPRAFGLLLPEGARTREIVVSIVLE